MTVGYVTFLQSVNFHTTNGLVGACHDLRNKGVTEVHLGIGSDGGSLDAGFSSYGALQGLGLQFKTYNLGSVNSVALLLYVLGQDRIAAPMSSFLFHGTNWTFNGNTVPATVIADAHNTLTQQEAALYGEIARVTGLPGSTIGTWRAASSNISAKDALSAKFCTSISPFAIPQGALHYQVG
jgi:ATP-dependent Clp protease, protease subunit